MSNEDHDNRTVQTVGRAKRIWLIAPGIVLGIVLAWVLARAILARDTRSADERLAEIETARAIGDSENAAAIYEELLRDSHATSLLDHGPDFLAGPAFNRRLNEPWRGKDHPELAAWIAENQYIIDKLSEASQFEQCRFPLSIDIVDTSPMDRAKPMRQWAFLLLLAANNDIAEGRIDGALEKWQSVLQMGNHLRQQPTRIDHLVANAVGRMALKPIVRYIVESDPAETTLQRIEALPLPTEDHSARHARNSRQIEDLTRQKVLEPLNALERVEFLTREQQMDSMIKETFSTLGPIPQSTTQERRYLATSRAIRILIAMRRHRSAAGRWPGNLDQIKPALSKKILTDPLNGGPFVYKPTQDTFALYSKGPNNIDENGRTEADGADDWPIWPPVERKLGNVTAPK